MVCPAANDMADHPRYLSGIDARRGCRPRSVELSTDFGVGFVSSEIVRHSIEKVAKRCEPVGNSCAGVGSRIHGVATLHRFDTYQVAGHFVGDLAPTVVSWSLELKKWFVRTDYVRRHRLRAAKQTRRCCCNASLGRECWA